MKVKLIGITKPVVESMEMFLPKDIISYCARVSNPANQENFTTADKLLAYCIKNQHWSVFEMVNVVMEIETTRDIARQILRHRSFSFQEFSQRYAAVTEMSEPREYRLQDPKNRQNSIEVAEGDRFAFKAAWEKMQLEMIKESTAIYEWAIAHGIAKEVARAVLPEGLTMSRMYVNGTLRSWITYCQVRMDVSTQKEHREVAEACWKIILEQFSFLKDVYKDAK